MRVGGKDIYLGLWNSPEADERYRAIVADWAGLEVERPAASLSAADLADEYLRRHAQSYYVKNDRLTKSYPKIRVACERLYSSGQMDGPADDFNPLHLMRYQKFLAELPGSPYARQTINEMVRAIVEIFRWGARHNLTSVKVEALEAVPPIRKGRPAPDSAAVTREQRRRKAPFLRDVAAALAHAGPTLDAMIRLHWLTGMRPGALVMMRRGDLTRQDGLTVYIPRPDAYKLEHVEDIPDYLRNVYIGPRAEQILAPLLDGLGPDDFVFNPRRAVALFNAAKRARRETPLWSSHAPDKRKARRGSSERRDGDHYTTTSYCRAIKRACEHAGLPKERWWSPNQLRHAAATRIRAKGGLDAAQILLGHASASTTERYAPPTIAKAIDAASRFG